MNDMTDMPTPLVFTDSAALKVRALIETPSPDDIAVTRQIIQAGKLLDIDVLDHIVIGGGRFVSLKDRGLGFS